MGLNYYKVRDIIRQKYKIKTGDDIHLISDGNHKVIMVIFRKSTKEFKAKTWEQALQMFSKWYEENT